MPIYHLPPKTSLRRRRDACHLRRLFSSSISNAFLLAARHRHQKEEALPARRKRVRRKPPPSRPAKILRLLLHFLSRATIPTGDFSFRAASASGDCLNQRFSTGTKSKGYVQRKDDAGFRQMTCVTDMKSFNITPTSGILDF